MPSNIFCRDFAHTAATGFKVPSGGASPPLGSSGGATDEVEEAGMPKEDPAKLERAPGEEDEEVFLDCVTFLLITCKPVKPIRHRSLRQLSNVCGNPNEDAVEPCMKLFVSSRQAYSVWCHLQIAYTLRV